MSNGNIYGRILLLFYSVCLYVCALQISVISTFSLACVTLTETSICINKTHEFLTKTYYSYNNIQIRL